MQAFLGEAGRGLRLMGALLLLACAGRVAWMSGTRLLARAPGTSPTPVTGEGGPLQHLFSPPPPSDHRPDLAALKEPKPYTLPRELSVEHPPDARRRAILVDLGPERSAVYVNGTKVGRTPYGGEVLCKDGDEIKIEVMPPHGLPLTQNLFCLGESIESRK